MKKHIFRYLLTVALSLTAAGAGAQMKTSYFMEGSIPRYDMNAALTPMHNYVNLPLLPLGSFGMNFNNNFLSLDNFIYKGQNGKHVLFLNESVDSKKFLNRMPRNASLNMDMNYNLVGFGKYNKKHDYFWSFNWNLRAVVDVNIPKDLFRVLKDLKNGSYDFSDISASMMTYSEFALGFTMPVGWENLVVGGRLKFLVGLAQAEAKLRNVTLDVTPTQVVANADGTMKASVFGMNFDDMPNGQKLDFGDVFDFDRFKMGNGFKSWGVAIDVGAEMKFLDDRLKVSFALNDLGFIKWSGKNSIYGDLSDVYFEFNGYNLNDEDWDYVEPKDVEFHKTDSSKGYGRRLSTTMNIGAEYNFLDNLLGVGLLSHTKFSNNVNYSELTLIGTVRPANWFTASISHSIVHNKFGIFGLAINFHPRGVNFFLGVDYIPMQFGEISKSALDSGSKSSGTIKWPVRGKSLNAYIGLAFTPKGRSKPWQ